MQRDLTMAETCDTGTKPADRHPDRNRGAFAPAPGRPDFDLAIGCGNYPVAVRVARMMACAAPDDPELAAVSKSIWRTGDLSVGASLSRMAQCLDSRDLSRVDERFHRSVKANRPELMPPHWMRDALLEARTLQTFIERGELGNAQAFLKRPDLVGHRYYVPRFRALQHFVNFNADPEYRRVFSENCIVVSQIIPDVPENSTVDINENVLDDLRRIAEWSEAVDLVVPASDLDLYPADAAKKLRSGIIDSKNFTVLLERWGKRTVKAFFMCWEDMLNKNLVEPLYGIPAGCFDSATSRTHFHINEIIAGPVLGPHYHSAQRHDKLSFPFLAAVYYPRSVPKSVTRAGYLEIGRPEFAVPFKPVCIEYRPVAGSLIVFPAFAYHGVLPIDRAPRYSINIDFYMKPAAAPTWKVSEFAERRMRAVG